MRNFTLAVLATGLTLLSLSPSIARAESGTAPEMKEWTLLVFLNGHNNLDSFGALNINQMEKVGSSKDLNIVVQWASLKSPSTKRLLVQKDNDPSTVTSPVVQDMGSVDMGDWRNVVEFVKWAHVHYPAKHYMIDMWDHGSGWHLMHQARTEAGFSPRDISWDDNTGNSITTKELGQAMTEAAKVIGHKVDIYSSDACLMAMAEIAGEMEHSVDVFAGSEETEPGAGWPYDAWIRKWATKPAATPAEVATFLADEYLKSYSGGSNGTSSVTFSAFDMSKYTGLTTAVTAFGQRLQKLGADERKAVVSAAGRAISFDYSDYVDLGDFLTQVDGTRLIDSGIVSDVRNATKDFVITARNSPSFANASGVAIWLPTYKGTFTSYSAKYKTMEFDRVTHWSDALQYLLQD